jgi:hypothetical protein
MALTHTRADGESRLRDLSGAIRTSLTRRRALWILGFGAVATGLALSWGWLAAIGIAPILVAVLPCAAMCALGLCMNKMGGRSCSQEKASQPGAPDISEPSPAKPPVIPAPVAGDAIVHLRQFEDAPAARSETGERV